MVRISFTFILVAILTLGAYGQDLDVTWLGSYTWVPDEPLHSRPDNYSKEDLEELRTMLQALKDASSHGGWDGYFGGGRR
jgi:hypothetical protein